MGEEVKLQSVSLDDEEDAASAMENGNGLADAKVRHRLFDFRWCELAP